MFKVLLSSAAVIVILAFAMVASAAFAASGITNHNCTNAITSAHLQDKIDNAAEGDVIEVSGDCIGADYVIAGDSLTLRGVGGATITGTGAAAAITIAGADKVTLEGFAVVDGDANDGILVNAGGAAVVRDIPLITGEDGVVVSGGFLEVNNSNVVGADDDGILAVQNATLLIRDTDVSGNGDDGVIAASGSVVHFNGGNTVNNNGGDGLLVSIGNAQFNGTNTVQDNSDIDINCFGFSRILVFQSVTSSSRNSRARDCLVAQVSGTPLFVDHPFNLVDCTPPGTANDDSIAEALANGLTFIRVRGLCDEHVSITTSNVTITGETLVGGNPVDGIQTDFAGSAIYISGAQNVNLNNLKVTGGRNTVTVHAASSARINNSYFSAGGAASIGRYGMFVGGNSWLELRDSSVLGGNGGGMLMLRNGILRAYNSDISAGATNKFALTLNNSVAYLYGVDLTGSLGAHFNSRTAFFNTFLGTFYGDSVIDSTIGPGQCSRYSNISAVPANIVEDTSATAFLNTDFSAFAECQVTIQ